MPLEVNGNFDLSVGRRLNLDGTVTIVGSILGVVDDSKGYVYSGSLVQSQSIGTDVWEDFQLQPTATTSIAGPVTWASTQYYLFSNRKCPSARPADLLQLLRPGQGTLVFDASNDTVTDRLLGDMLVSNGGSSLNGISSNSNYAGKAHCASTNRILSTGLTQTCIGTARSCASSTNAFDVMAPTLLNNLLNGSIHYIANSTNVGLNPVEQILIGNATRPRLRRRQRTKYSRRDQSIVFAADVDHVEHLRFEPQSDLLRNLRPPRLGWRPHGRLQPYRHGSGRRFCFQSGLARD